MIDETQPGYDVTEGVSEQLTVSDTLSDERLDDFNRKVFQPQIDGSKTGLELPGIVDEVITMAELKADGGDPYRAFVCHTINPWGFPAKDRSGRLGPVEEPHLGRLMDKIRATGTPAPRRLTFTPPAEGAADHPHPQS